MAERKKAKPRKRRTRRSKPPAKTGRPAKIEQEITFTNPRTQEEESITVAEFILQQMRVGTPLKYAAQSAGVDERTVKRWIARGREFLVDGSDPEDAPASDLAYVTFATGVVRARGGSVAYYVTQLYRAAGKGSARAAIEWLRAQAADEFKQRIGVELSDERKPPPLKPEDDEEYRRAFATAFRDELPELDPSELLPPEVVEGEGEDDG